MIQTPVSATDHQIAILKSLANSGIRQFAAGGKASAFGDSAGQEIGEAEQGKVWGDWSRAIRSGPAEAPDLGKILQAETETRGLHPGITTFIWVRFSHHLGKISRRGETSRKARSILPYGRISGWNAPKCKVSKVGVRGSCVSLSPLLPFPPPHGQKSALLGRKFAARDFFQPAGRIAHGSPRRPRSCPAGTAPAGSLLDRLTPECR